jgi:enamine deaminase RidA (YjgF/YER057c/UK114 family)
MNVRDRITALKLEIPPAQRVSDDVKLTYRRLARDGSTVYLAGHGPTWGDAWGSPLGKIGRDLSIDEGVAAARLTALNVLGTIERELGDLDRVGSWLKVTGFVNAVDGFTEQARVMNGFSDLLLELYGPERLASRSSVGVADLPFGMPVEADAVIRWEGK